MVTEGSDILFSERIVFHLREYRGLQKQLQWGWEDPKSDLGGNTITNWRGDRNSCGGRYLVDVISMYFTQCTIAQSTLQKEIMKYT